MTDSHVVTEAVSLLEVAKCVLFDFDGPLCGLFEHHPAPRVAARLRVRARQHFRARVPAAWESVDDPQVILINAAAMEPHSQVVADLEKLLTSEELVAAAAATPTEGADRLIRQLSAAGKQLAITTNNSARAVQFYLRRVELTGYFGRHVHGRTTDPQLLKPDPDCLRRALATTGSSATESLMIGDSVADYEAATTAGVAFLGCARSEARRGSLKEAGAMVVVNSISELLPALDAVAPGLRVE
ncbi:HAD family hydrolase [Streptomyces maoxianensis]|uniref:HAD family hydrolase n=1 Tax=Streptomyces maoxianensis TaxID=1459942 RepID=A0ABV9G5K3_9ACTN